MCDPILISNKNENTFSHDANILICQHAKVPQTKIQEEYTIDSQIGKISIGILSVEFI
jgi:hypothetical protein